MARGRISPGIALGALMGTALEWYDVFLFAVAGVYISKAFFPSDDPLAGLMAVYVAYGVTFVFRPVGALLFGYLGDKAGRRTALFWTLLLAGLSTSLIGLVPDYARWGVAAPVLVVLLRILIGLSIGGEWGAATSYIYDMTPRKTLAQILVQSGVSLGILLASGMLLFLEYLLGDAVLDWAWRLAFLFSVVLVVIGLLFRVRFPEAVEYEEAKEKAGEVPNPIGTVLRQYPWPMLAGIFLTGAVGAGFMYSWTTLPGTARAQGIIDNNVYLLVVFGFGLAELWGVILGGILGERWGNLPLIFAGLLGMTVTGLLAGEVLNHIGLLVFAVLLGGFSHGVAYAPQASFLSSLFPTLARTTGVSFAYQVGNALGSGLTPFVSTYLTKTFGWEAGGYYVVAFLLLGMAAAMVGARQKATA